MGPAPFGGWPLPFLSHGLNPFVSHRESYPCWGEHATRERGFPVVRESCSMVGMVGFGFAS